MYELEDLRELENDSWLVQIKTPLGKIIEYVQIICSKPIHDKVADKIDKLNSEYGSWTAQNKRGAYPAISTKGDILRLNRYKARQKQLFASKCEERDAEYRMKQEKGIV